MPILEPRPVEEHLRKELEKLRADHARLKRWRDWYDGANIRGVLADSGLLLVIAAMIFWLFTHVGSCLTQWHREGVQSGQAEQRDARVCRMTCAKHQMNYDEVVTGGHCLCTPRTVPQVFRKEY